jgi:D-3-phosphoglycerate dehydrogenase
MSVAAYDPYASAWMEEVTRASSLEHLFTRSDVLSLHVPLTQETTELVGADELARLPRGASLINTSRGEVVDELALVQALEQGHLAGAGLDVIAGERDPKDRERSPLIEYSRTHDNLLITPHIGGATHESMAKTEIFMARKLESFLNARQGK